VASTVQQTDVVTGIALFFGGFVVAAFVVFIAMELAAARGKAALMTTAGASNSVNSPTTSYTPLV
jgi:hypothetical protein